MLLDTAYSTPPPPRYLFWTIYSLRGVGPYLEFASDLAYVLADDEGTRRIPFSFYQDQIVCLRKCTTNIL